MQSIPLSMTRLGWALPLVALALAACEPARSVGVLTEELAAPSLSKGLLPADGAFLVGNFSPDPGSTNGILRYTSRGEFVDMFAPAGSGGLTIACCMAYGPDENLYVGSPFTSNILRYNGATGEFIDEFVRSGAGGLGAPVILAFGPDGNLYVGDFGADFASPAVRRYDGRTGAFIDVFVAPHAGGMVMADDPQHFVWGPDGHFYVAAPVAGKVLRFDGRTGEFIDAFVSNQEGRPAVGSGLAFGPDGHLYVNGDDAVSRYDGRTGEFIDVFVPRGSGGLSGPVGLLFGPDRHLYVASADGGSVLRYDGRTGRFIDAFIPAGSGGISGPRMIAFKLKMKVCHRPPGNPGKARTILVAQLDAADHVAHGDRVGACHE